MEKRVKKRCFGICEVWEAHVFCEGHSLLWFYSYYVSVWSRQQVIPFLFISFCLESGVKQHAEVPWWIAKTQDSSSVAHKSQCFQYNKWKLFSSSQIKRVRDSYMRINAEFPHPSPWDRGCDLWQSTGSFGGGSFEGMWWCEHFWWVHGASTSRWEHQSEAAGSVPTPLLALQVSNPGLWQPSACLWPACKASKLLCITL